MITKLTRGQSNDSFDHHKQQAVKIIFIIFVHFEEKKPTHTVILFYCQNVLIAFQRGRNESITISSQGAKVNRSLMGRDGDMLNINDNYKCE